MASWLARLPVNGQHANQRATFAVGSVRGLQTANRKPPKQVHVPQKQAQLLLDDPSAPGQPLGYQTKEAAAAAVKQQTKASSTGQSVGC